MATKKAPSRPSALVRAEHGATATHLSPAEHEVLDEALCRDKLAEGIDGFTKSLVSLEKMLGERLAKL